MGGRRDGLERCTCLGDEPERFDNLVPARDPWPRTVMTVLAFPSPHSDGVRFSRLKGAKVRSTARKHLPRRREYCLTARRVEFDYENRAGGSMSRC